MQWTDDRLREGRAEWARLSSSNAAAAVLRERWAEPRLTGASLRVALSAYGHRLEAAQSVVSANAQSVARGTPSDRKLVCILSDLHIPEHDERAVDCALRWIEQERPSIVVLNGDIGEWESCSQHGTSASAPTFLADVEAVRAFLARLRKLVPDARIVFLEGNHETRLSRFLCAQAPALHGALTVRSALGLDTLGIEWVPEDTKLDLGDLRIIHGHQGSRGAGGIYGAARAANTWGGPGRTVAVGHTHKRQMFRRPMSDGHAEAHLLPCLRSLVAGWLHGEVAGWSHGFAVATQRPGRRTALEVVDIEGGSCVWGGRTY